MTINIVNTEENWLFNGEDYYLPAKYLEFTGVHIFIASHHWDKLKIQICEDIPANVMRYVRQAVDTIDVVDLPDTITSHIVEVLCELFPDRAGKIRRQFLLGADIKEVLV